jgi:hypothetical protein
MAADIGAAAPAPVATPAAPYGIDYTGLLAGQLGYIDSTYALAPMSLVPVPN